MSRNKKHAFSFFVFIIITLFIVTNTLFASNLGKGLESNESTTEEQVVTEDSDLTEKEDTTEVENKEEEKQVKPKEEDGATTGNQVEPQKEKAPPKKQPRALEDVNEYMSLRAFDGIQAVSDVESDAQASTTASGVATYEDGKIHAHNEGNAVITIPMEEGNNKIVHVSVYFECLQPAQAVVNKTASLSQWAKPGNTDYFESDIEVNSGDVVTVLYRVKDQNSSAVMQYVKTSSNQKGYLSSDDSDVRESDVYSRDVAVGEDIYASTLKDGAVSEDEVWSSADVSVASAQAVSHDGKNNQGKITGEAEGTCIITATSAVGAKTSSYVSVYTKFAASLSGAVNKQTSIKSRPSNDSADVETKNSEDAVTIQGQSGSYYLIGTGKYVLKSDVDISADSVSLDHNNATLYTSGDANSLTLTATVSPASASGSLSFESSDTSVATVSASGVITAHAQGTATIKVKIGTTEDECAVKVIEPVTNVNLDSKSTPLKVNSSKTVSAEFTPATLLEHSSAWTSGDSSLASIDSGGEITAGNAEGITYINNTQTPPAATTGTAAGAVSGKTLVSVYSETDKDEIVETKADNTTIYSAAVKPTSSSYQELQSENSLVADQYTKFKIIGSCGDFYYIKDIDSNTPLGFIEKSDVEKVITNIALSHSTAVLYTSGDATSFTLVPTTTPAGFELKVTFESSDTSVASISAGGVVTAHSQGTATITAKSGDTQSTCNVTVVKPVESVTLPKKMTVKVSSSVPVNAVYEPNQLLIHQSDWTTSDTSIATVNSQGKVTTKAKEGVIYVTSTQTPPAPTSGTAAASASGKTLMSVYSDTDKGVALETLNDNVAVYPIAATVSSSNYPEFLSENQNIANKDTALFVIGSSGNFYYVKYADSGDIAGFVAKSDVRKTSVVHTERMPASTYTPTVGGVKILLPTSTYSVSASVLSGSTTGAVTLVKSKSAYTGNITVNKKGISKIKVIRTHKTKKTSSYYYIHMNMPHNISNKAGYVTESSAVHNCASDTCHYTTLSAGTKVTVTGTLGSKVRISFAGSGGAVSNKYIESSKISYVNVNPIVLSSTSKAYQTKDVNFSGVENSDKVIKTAAASSSLIKVKKGTNNVQVIYNTSSKLKNGYTTLTVTGGSTGKYAAYIPVTVYTPSSARSAYLRCNAAFKSGASTNTHVKTYHNLKKSASVKILGSAGDYYYIDCGNKNIGDNGRGFVRKADVVFINITSSSRVINRKVKKKTILY